MQVNLKLEHIWTHGSVVAEPGVGDPRPAVPAADPSVAPAELVSPVEAVLLPLGLRSREQLQTKDTKIPTRNADGRKSENFKMLFNLLRHPG